MSMTDAEAQVQQDRWMAIGKKWIDRLRVWQWELKYHWHREPLDARPLNERDKPTGSMCEVNEGRPAQVWVQWPYMVADIEVDLRIISMMSDAELEKLYLHEMGHLLLSGLDEFRDNKKAYKKAEERTATELSLILFHLLNDTDDEDEQATSEATDATSEVA